MREKSQTASLITELAGLVTIVCSAFGKWATQNHELIWSLGVLGGFIVAFVGLIFNVYYMRARDKRERERHALEMKRRKTDKA